MPIFKETFKSSCDQGYVVHKRICEIEEAARAEGVRKQKEAAAQKARDAACAAGTTDEGDIKALEGLAMAGVKEGSKIAPMSHLDFLEKIAEGFVIEAYNSTKEKGYNSKPEQKQMKLDAYDLSMLERALEEMRGTAAPSDGAHGPTMQTPRTGHGAAAGGAANKRKLEVSAALERAARGARAALGASAGRERCAHRVAGRYRKRRPHRGARAQVGS
eukprot:7379498-Prymnesium_polylepis.2